MPKVLIPAKLARGLLPNGKPLKMWAGIGSGHPCDGCGRSITATDLEYELDFADGRRIRLHRECSAIWHTETGN
jgi:hypothetical protein